MSLFNPTCVKVVESSSSYHDVNCTVSDVTRCRGMNRSKCIEDPTNHKKLLVFEPNSDTAFQVDLICTEPDAGGDWELLLVYVQFTPTRKLIINRDYFHVEYVENQELPGGGEVAIGRLTFKAATYNSDPKDYQRCNLRWAILNSKDIFATINVPDYGAEDVLIRFGQDCP